LFVVIVLLVLNLSGLIPYGFGLNNYPLVTLGLAIGYWWLFAYVYQFFVSRQLKDSVLSRFLPQGCPVGLWLFLPVMELISIVIQPITLLLRITANLVVGHFLMFFVTKLVVYASLVLAVGLYLFELFVSCVQTFVFLLLLKNYRGFMKSD